MEEKATYRSAARSRRQIRQAFLQLLQEKELSRITVTDIVKKADISRSTFYTHYPDVWGVMEEFQNECIEWVTGMLDQVAFRDFLAHPMPTLLRVSRMIEEQKETYRVLFQCDVTDSFMRRLEQIILERILSEPDVDSAICTSKCFAIRFHFCVGGIYNLCSQWLSGDLECSAEDIAAELERLISALKLR